MAGVKISQLPVIVTPAMSDIFPVVQAGTTYKETFTQLSSLFATAGANSNITSLTGLLTPLSLSQGGTGAALTSPVLTKLNIQRVTTPGAGTYTPTTGMQFVIVCAQAAGGGGGGADTSGANQFALGEGGGGGEYIEALFTAAQIGASKAYSIGAKGTGGAAGNNNGTAGGNTTFNTNWITTIGGGFGVGGAAAGGDAFFSNPTTRGSGGSVITGQLIRRISGSNQNIAFALNLVQAVPSYGGNSGSGYIGATNNVINTGSATAGSNADANTGAGGCGGGTANAAAVAGGDGADGWITFIEFISI